MTLFLFHTVLIPGFRMRSLETNIGLCFVRDLQHSLLRIEKHRCFKPISPVYFGAHSHKASCYVLSCFTYHVPAVSPFIPSYTNVDHIPVHDALSSSSGSKTG
jgi:hypothetical protein